MLGTERELLLKRDPRPWEPLAGVQDGWCRSWDELQDTVGPSPPYASCAWATRKELEMPPRCRCSLLMLADRCPVIQSSPAWSIASQHCAPLPIVPTALPHCPADLYSSVSHC